MDVALEGEEAESARRARVKELEAMVLQLERENKKLLNKVTESADKFREEALSVAAERDSDRRGRVGSTDDLISLDGFSGETNEDEWLFVSPAKPPTPAQKKVTPSEWLERGGAAAAGDPLFSLDEVRKDLSFQISNAESLSPSNARRTPGNGVVKSPLSARRKLSNPTAQRYLDQVRDRRNSPPVEVATPDDNEEEEERDREEREAVPVVRWKRPVVPPDTQTPVRPPTDKEREQAVPVVRWRRPVLPQPEEAREDAIPVVRWKKPVIPSNDSPEPGTEDAVPVVRWKKPVIPSNDSPEPETVPVVKWKRPVVPVDDSPEEELTVRWKKPVMPQEKPENGEVRPRPQRNTPVKAISTTAKSPPEQEEEDEQGFRGHQSNTLPRASARRSLGGGLRPPGGGRGVPQRNASAERASQRQPGQTSLRSRSPSPGLRQPTNLRSRSPSPHTSPMATPPMRSSRAPRKQTTPPLTQASLQPSPGKQSIVKSVSTPGHRKLPTPPSSGRSERGLSPSVSAPSNQRMAVTPPTRHIGLSPPSSGRPAWQPQPGVTATTPRSGGVRPRPQQSPQRGGVAQLSQSAVSAAHSRAQGRGSSSLPRQSKGQPQSKPVQPVAMADDDWLEGCY